MSAEDETFDIDLYGDEPEVEEEQYYNQPDSAKAEEAADSDIHESAKAETIPQRSKLHSADHETHKIELDYTKDERPLDQDAQVSLKLNDLQWWTTEEDLRYFCSQARCEDELVEVAFGEHKINGKSKGEAYLEFKTPQAAGMVKRQIDKANDEVEAGKTLVAGGKTKISVWYTMPGNPFKTREGPGKKEVTAPNKYNQGAYNSNHPRGGFTPRGRGQHGRGGSQWSNQSVNNNFNSNMMPGFSSMGYNAFPNMQMMNSLMSGGFNMGMGMGMPAMMQGRGGANMMSRGGWNTGYQQQQQQGYNNAGWDSNKRPRQE